MTKLVPGSTPRYSRANVEAILDTYPEWNPRELSLLGIEGYYADTMGVPGQNDIGIYDDAIFIIGPDCFISFNANTDPSRRRQRMADLDAGVWEYKLGIHGLSKPKAKQYKALVQAKAVTVTRWQVGKETGFFGINIHRGSYTGTSSLGCQTIYPDQWTSFISTVETQMKKLGQKTIKYLKV